MKTFIRLVIAIAAISMFIISCKPDTAKDDPIGTGSGRSNGDMGKSEDTTAASSSTPMPGN